ncbi:patronin isoform X2 [Lutzomyia longipalpis]|uniref:patronin isoform X2 n=1 Tax=Lutzomyia longipalpis TaxID=7200 RepID=UPI002484280B|nr:patronin isoform X2 [Lutzomyia longipalpis]
MDKNFDGDSVLNVQTKQKASVKWLLSKAYNNQVPVILKEPFYRDNSGIEQLKPQIITGLGNASLYCQTLSNLYSDPNYQNLNHGTILQILIRKCVLQPENSETPLTETILIQTNPLKTKAHMALIEALMALYVKEVGTFERISSAVLRITGRSLPSEGQPGYQDPLLAWVGHVCGALKVRIDAESGNQRVPELEQWFGKVPFLVDYNDLSDGVCLAFLISYYCPKLVPWHTIRVNYIPTVEDCIYNMHIVSSFCQQHLPYSVYHMIPEDIAYIKGTMKQNLQVFVADLFNLFEIHLVNCITHPDFEKDKLASINEHGVTLRRGLTNHPTVITIPDLRSNLESAFITTTTKPHSSSGSRIALSPPLARQSSKTDTDSLDSAYVVHRSRPVPTLTSIHHEASPPPPSSADRMSSHGHGGEERHSMDHAVAAGRPSNWDEHRKQSFAGRRSRRNSLSDDSQLTIENFGGSQEHLNNFFRADREQQQHRASPGSSIGEPAVPVRCSLQDARGTFQLGYDADDVAPAPVVREEIRRSNSVKATPTERIVYKDIQFSPETRFAVQKNKINSFFINNAAAENNGGTTTTWQQQKTQWQQMEESRNDGPADDGIDDRKLSSIRSLMEEKRRHIETEKRKMEMSLSQQHKKLGEVAYIQTQFRKENSAPVRPACSPPPPPLPVVAPPVSNVPNDDMMAPQNISFLGDEEEHEENHVMRHRSPREPFTLVQAREKPEEFYLTKVNVSNGNQTYRLPTPGRTSITSQTFADHRQQQQQQHQQHQQQQVEKSGQETGFFIGFDTNQPIKPKPMLRTSHPELRRAERVPQPRQSPQTPPQPAQRRDVEMRKQHVEQRFAEEPQITPSSAPVLHRESPNVSRKGESLLLALDDSPRTDTSVLDEMERKKEKIMLLSLKRREQQEEVKARKELEAMRRREREAEKEAEKARKKEEMASRRQHIFEAYKLKKSLEEAEREGKSLDKAELFLATKQKSVAKRTTQMARPRPKTIHIESGSIDMNHIHGRPRKEHSMDIDSGTGSSSSMKRDFSRDQDSGKSSLGKQSPVSRTSSSVSSGVASFRGRKSNSLMNLSDSSGNLYRPVAPRRAQSPMGRHITSPSGPGSLPPGLVTKRRGFDDGASDISSTPSSILEYSGPKLYKQPTAKSNRGIILNAVEYCVFPGTVNRDAKQKLLEKIARSEAKHFLILFRDAGCQFRALYSFYPESDSIIKLCGTGPSQVDDVMFDKFYKYNSGSKSFSQIHTKHLTVTIDAFTIHNALWMGKKVNLLNKKDMVLVV